MLTQPTSNKSQLSNKSNKHTRVSEPRVHDTSYLEHVYFGFYHKHKKQ